MPVSSRDEDEQTVLREGGGHRVVITPPRRLRLPSWATVWEAREVFVRFGVRDVKLRYRQTALGVVWVVLQPLLSAGVFTLVFGGVAQLPSDGVPYFAMSFAGMLAWNTFNSILSRASTSLVSNSALISKVFFPRIIVPLSGTYSVLLDMVVSLAFFVVLLFVYGINPGWPVLLIPVWMTLVVVLAAGIGMVASALMVKYRDVGYILPVITSTLLYATPIAYTLSAVPARYRIWFQINPLTWIMQEFRWSLLGMARPETWQVAGSVGVAGLVFVVGALVFEHYERSFADII